MSANTNDVPSVLNKGAKNYNGIDLVKFICAIFVCMIHIDPLPKDSFEVFNFFNFAFQNYLCRIAVPFYFVASGFFLFLKMDYVNIRKDVVKKYCYNILRLLGLWSILLVIGGVPQLWYLGATVVAVLTLYLLFSLKIKCRYVVCIAGLLYIVGLLGDSYYGITEYLKQISIIDYGTKAYEMFFQTTRNGVFMGVIFLLVGALFARGLIRMKLWVAVLGFVASMIMLLGEIFALSYLDLSKSTNMYVFLVPATIFLFSIATTIELKDRPIYKTLRAAGVIVYFSHMLMFELVMIAFSAIKKFTGIDIWSCKFIVTAALTILLALFVVFLAKHKKFRWLRWLYS